MPHPTIAAVCMPDRGHFQRIRPVVAGLAALGARVVVHTGAQLRHEAESHGGEFRDLFAAHSIDEADAESWPPVVRYVSFAGAFAERLRDEIGASSPDMVLYDTFAVPGWVAARLLGIPYVNVCAGHAVVPERFEPLIDRMPRLFVSPVCRRAVERLRSQFGFTDVSPFSYMAGQSPHLNLYCEPPQFLPEADRHVFEPLAFFGSLAADPAPVEDRAEYRRRWFDAGADECALYVSFGTHIWLTRTVEALRALTAVADWAAAADYARVLISLGGARLSAEDRARLERPHVKVAEYVDQCEVLGCADAFVTHHGLNSTHEAVAYEVPMISYPFIWDQPGLAAECQRLDLAVPLVDTPMAPITPDDVERAVTTVRTQRTRFAEALARAHQWEREVIASRPVVLRQVLALCGRR